MNPMLKPSDKSNLLGVIAPQSAAPGTVVSGWLDASKHHQILARLQVGTLGASATVDAKFQQATSSGGAGAKDITGASITQLTKAGADDNKVVDVNLDPNKLDRENGFRYVQFSVTVGVAASLVAAIVAGFEPRYLGSSPHAAAMDEVVAVF